MRKNRFLQGLIGIAILATTECAGPAAIGFVLTGTAQAQDFPFLSRQRPARNDGFFQQLFGPSNRRLDERDSQQRAGAGRLFARAGRAQSRSEGRAARADDLRRRPGQRHGRLARLWT